MKTWCWRAVVASIGVTMMWVTMSSVAAARTTKAAKANGGGEPSVTYAVRAGGAGEMVLTADAAVLQIEKSVFEDGRTSLVLKSDRDEVTIAFDRNGVTTVSGDGRATINGAQPDEAAFGRTRALLAKSKAARLFRDLVAAIERRDEPPSLYDRMLLVSLAEMSRFEGDTTATEVLGKRLGLKKDARKAPAAALRPVSCGGVARVQFQDCVQGWEISVMNAWNTWNGCYRGVFDSGAWYLQNMELWFCDVELFVRLESYAFQFVRCSAMPF